MDAMNGEDQIVIYKSADGNAQLEVKLEEETVWLTLNQIADLFDRDKSVVSRHINAVYNEGELDREATVAKYATVQTSHDFRLVQKMQRSSIHSEF